MRGFRLDPANRMLQFVHLAALLFLGPLGHNYNWVVWPWNLAMIGLVWALFAAQTPPRLKPTLAEVRTVPEQRRRPDLIKPQTRSA